LEDDGGEEIGVGVALDEDELFTGVAVEVGRWEDADLKSAGASDT